MKRNIQGLTLIEVVLSIAILAVVVLILPGIQTFSLRTTRGAADTHELVRQAEASIERVTGRYLSGDSSTSPTLTAGIDAGSVEIKRCTYESEEIKCYQLESFDATKKEVGIFITTTAAKGDHAESLYRFVMRP